MYCIYEDIQYCITGGTKVCVSNPVYTPTVAQQRQEIHNNKEQQSANPETMASSSSTPSINEKANNSTSSFRPTFLVRTADMAVVPGHEAKNGYCTLSYCWDWSGILTSNNSNQDSENKCRVDHGLHTLIDHGDVLGQTIIGVPFEYNKNSNSRSNNRQAHHYRLYNEAGQSYDFIPEKQRHTHYHKVKFERIIQQLCRQFDIEYIWYDQLCIDNHQNPSRSATIANKRKELRQMHQIYSQADYTLAMIPEMHYTKHNYINYRDVIDNGTNDTHQKLKVDQCFYQLITSKWCKRVWPFGEAVASNKILFVGRNVHMWSDTILSNLDYAHTWWIAHAGGSPEYLLQVITTILHQQQSNGQNDGVNINASTALWHINKRQCLKPHDKIFALAMVYPDLLLDNITFSYKQPLLPLMNRAYSLLAIQDLSVLCFGKKKHGGLFDVDKEKGKNLRVIEQHWQQQQGDMLNQFAPSWTGLTQEATHLLKMAFHSFPPRTQFSDYHVSPDDDQNGYLEINSKSITVNIDLIERKNMFPRQKYDINFKELKENTEEKSYVYEANRVTIPTVENNQQQRQQDSSIIVSMDSTSYYSLPNSTGLVATHWLSQYSKDSGKKGRPSFPSAFMDQESAATLWFSLIKENCNQCIILYDVIFEIDFLPGFKAYPIVIKQPSSAISSSTNSINIQLSGASTTLDRYRSIGLCFARNIDFLGYDKEGSTQKFIIT